MFCALLGQDIRGSFKGPLVLWLKLIRTFASRGHFCLTFIFALKLVLIFYKHICSCGNVNWARRMTCNMCNTPKYGKQEQRTGRQFNRCTSSI